MKQMSAPPAPARTPPPPPVIPYRPPYLAAGLAALAVWLLYAVTLAPTTQFWDTSEYIATAHLLGIPHPPGNPLFVVLARAWEVLLAPTGLSVAVRINLFSATMGALAHGCWFLLAHRIMAFFTADNRVRLVGAAAAVLVSATAFTVWNQSNVNEKVYTVSLFTIALLSWLAFHWRDNLGQGKDDNLLLLMVFILALSVGNHLMAFLAAPALVLFVLLVAPRTLTNWRLYGGAAVVTIVGLSIHLFLPIRAQLDPVINEADPSCPSTGSAIISVVTYGSAGCEALSDALKRRQYDKPSMFSDPTDPRYPRSAPLLAAQIGNYLQYFDWQWARSAAGRDPLFGKFRWAFTLLFAGLGLYGAWTHWKRDRVSWAFVAVLFATLSVGLVIYLNFRYGYSYATAEFPSRDAHEVRERDYFFIVSFSIWGLWSGIGITALWQRTAAWLGERRRLASDRAQLLASFVLLLAVLPLFLNWTWASRRHDYAARDWAYNLLMSIEPYGVLFTNGDNDTFPLWYLQEVEGVRRDVTVIVMSYLNTPWYVKQLKQLTTPCPAGTDPEAEDPTRIICQRRFRPEMAPAFYAADMRTGDAPGEPVPGIAPPGTRSPRLSIFESLSDQQIEQVASTPAFLTQEAMPLEFGRIQTTLARGSLIIPSDQFLGWIVSQAIEDRPIYFATTTQAYEELNLGGFLIRQGVAFKLNNGPIQEDSARGIYQVPPSQLSGITGGFIDLPRTDSLAFGVYIHRGGIPDEWDHWVDRATQGIPFYYFYVHYAAMYAHDRLGNDAMRTRHEERAQAWVELGQK